VRPIHLQLAVTNHLSPLSEVIPFKKRSGVSQVPVWSGVLSYGPGYQVNMEFSVGIDTQCSIKYFGVLLQNFFNSLTAKFFPAGTKISRSERHLLRKHTAHKHHHHDGAVKCSLAAQNTKQQKDVVI
jgi:hypothetical protein